MQCIRDVRNERRRCGCGEGSHLKRLTKILTSRSLLFCLLSICQIVIFFMLVWQFSTTGRYTYVVMTIISVLVVIFVFDKDDLNPTYKIMWVLLTVIFPVTGALSYLLWGNRRISPRKAKDFRRADKESRTVLRQDPGALNELNAMGPDSLREGEYLTRAAGAPVWSGTESRYFSCGKEYFDALADELERAGRSIDIECFLISPGRLWDRILEILRRKAAAGVDVRVLWDGVGSMFTLPDDYAETLEGYGIQARVFNRLRLTYRIGDYVMENYRDHRKIIVIDGKTALTGGLNIADEYAGMKVRFGYWKDTGVLLRGPAVRSLEIAFLKMWGFAAGLEPEYSALSPEPAGLPADGLTQPYTGMPLDSENACAGAYRNLICRAKRYLYITTPYLVIDYDMQAALSLAAKSGVDVRIVTPGIPDKHTVYLLTRSHYRQLLQAGVRIFEYTPGFMHAKMFVSDDLAAVVGSANMDFRSLYLHFEDCCAFYGGRIVGDVKADFLHVFDESREITMEDVSSAPPWIRLLQMFFRFFAPLL